MKAIVVAAVLVPYLRPVASGYAVISSPTRWPVSL
jgi:hypothetical protein